MDPRIHWWNWCESGQVGFVSRSELAKDYKNDDASLQSTIWSRLFYCFINCFKIGFQSCCLAARSTLSMAGSVWEITIWCSDHFLFEAFDLSTLLMGQWIFRMMKDRHFPLRSHGSNHRILRVHHSSWSPQVCSPSLGVPAEPASHGHTCHISIVLLFSGGDFPCCCHWWWRLGTDMSKLPRKHFTTDRANSGNEPPLLHFIVYGGYE